MRRMVPWALLVLLGMVTAAGAALGIAQKDSSQAPAIATQRVSELLRTTAQAGSAHFTYVQDTMSPNFLLRQTIRGNGAVDFLRNDAWATETDHSFSFTNVTVSPATGQPVHATPSTTTTKEIVVGGVFYEQLGFPDNGGRFVKLALPTGFAVAHGHFGLALNASVAIAELIGPYPIHSVEPVTVPAIEHQAPHGVPTTAYVVRYAPLLTCNAGQPHRLTQPSSVVWVDGNGRLVQVRSLYFFAGFPRAKIPAAFANFPRGPTTTVATLTFSHFGDPVRISAPPPAEVLSPSSTGIGSRAEIRAKPCPSN